MLQLRNSAAHFVTNDRGCDFRCHETPHRPHRPQIQRYLTLNKQQEQQNASQKCMKTVTRSFS